MAVITSKKLGNAVKRNKIRRKVKEAVRKINESNEACAGIVFIASNCVDRCKFVDLEAKISKMIWMAVDGG